MSCCLWTISPFAALKDRPVLVVGTGEIADRKIAFLQRAGAQVQIVAEADFEESQIDSVVLVIAATEDRALNRRISDAAGPSPSGERGRRPAVMLIYLPVDCRPLATAGGDLSGGTAPVLARVLREKSKRCCRPASDVWRRRPATGATI